MHLQIILKKMLVLVVSLPPVLAWPVFVGAWRQNVLFVRISSVVERATVARRTLEPPFLGAIGERLRTTVAKSSIEQTIATGLVSARSIILGKRRKLFDRWSLHVLAIFDPSPTELQEIADSVVRSRETFLRLLWLEVEC